MHVSVDRIKASVGCVVKPEQSVSQTDSEETVWLSAVRVGLGRSVIVDPSNPPVLPSGCWNYRLLNLNIKTKTTHWLYIVTATKKTDLHCTEDQLDNGRVLIIFIWN